MSKQINISIPSPCHENWQAMTPAQKGKFCGSCQKVVHDFTLASDREIGLILKQDENACGRFRNDQLNRNLLLRQPVGSPWLASAAILSLLTFGVNEAAAQTPVSTVQYPVQNEIMGKVAATRSDPITVSGVVLDSGSLPIPGAKVTVKGSQKSISTDFDGKFSIEALPGDVVVFQYIGMKESSHAVDKKSVDITVILSDGDNYLMGEVVIVRNSIFRRIGNSIANLFRTNE